jgi:CDP-diacylglycerol--glycerol-3-phosphate 3-phosphatidyltransferase
MGVSLSASIGRGTVAGIYVIKPAFQRSLGGIERWLVARRVHPDWLTGAALLLSIGGGVALYYAPQARWLLALVPLVAVVRTALNALDGLVAKRTGLARPWGEVLNELSDRFADVALFGGIALAAPSSLLLGAGAITMMLLSSYLAILSKAAGGRRQYMGPMGKADRMVLLILGSLLGFAVPLTWAYNGMLWIVLVGCLLTLIRRAQATYADLQATGSR